MGGLLALLTATSPVLFAAGGPIGIFEEQSSVGNVTRPGSGSFETSRAAYTMTGGGENMWAASDAFHFAWKRAKGDQALSAEISFANVSGDPHKKAVLMFRQSLATDAAYASAALHNDGLTSLQARAENEIHSVPRHDHERENRGDAADEANREVRRIGERLLDQRRQEEVQTVAGDDVREVDEAQHEHARVGQRLLER